MFSSVYQKIVMYLIYRLFPDTFTDSERIFMIQDITPHHLYNEFTPRSPQNGDLILLSVTENFWQISQQIPVGFHYGKMFLHSFPPLLL